MIEMQIADGEQAGGIRIPGRPSATVVPNGKEWHARRERKPLAWLGACAPYPRTRAPVGVRATPRSWSSTCESSPADCNGKANPALFDHSLPPAFYAAALVCLGFCDRRRRLNIYDKLRDSSGGHAMGIRTSALVGSMIFTFVALPLSAASIQTIKPEETGLSSERLQRIHEAVQRHIDAHEISGAVTVVARRGRLAHLEAHGLMDVATKKVMSKDTLFWLASMTKPVTGTAILMLMEEGKVRLADPVSKFIPEFRGMKVAVMQEKPAGPGLGPL